MGENSSAPTVLESKKTIISKDLSPDSISKLNGFLKSMGVFNLTFPSQYDTKDSFSELTRGFLKVQHIHRGKISCIVSVKPPIMNFYGSLHGGAIGAVAARVATGCARTIVGKDKELFLGELSISYLSGAPRNVERPDNSQYQGLAMFRDFIKIWKSSAMLLEQRLFCFWWLKTFV
ncbi:uncharacterized protein LOC132645684 isoform X2 [Lycium barbarum]|uniref:uncharacterized protein LOC132645684 isoform X2 n=1 Tax=Lycium barbarum TaxID=112863 RepID=UPI00293E41AF|nr:uncharacterized protein LOC132645684 isoform X2 [Lycium barbarum]